MLEVALSGGGLLLVVQTSSTVVGQTFAGSAIECLSVSGDTATFVFDTTPPGARFKVTVTDDNVGDDLFGMVALDPSTPADCSPVPETFIGFITTGDIVVHDAPAPTTSKDQCKNGGWKNLRRLQEPGGLRQLRSDEGEELAGESAPMAGKPVPMLLDSVLPRGVGHASH